MENEHYPFVRDANSENEHYPFVNLPLPYDYNVLEPFIDGKTMHLHHDKHLQSYIDNLNGALKDYPRLHCMTLEQLIRNIERLPRGIQTAVRNNAGGVYNHRFFFDGMRNPAKNGPDGCLAEEIKCRFGSFGAFREEFAKAALSVFGSGYAWLVTDRGRAGIVTTANQNSPIERNLCPILTVDVWEHAYYLKHYNVRAGYIDDFLRVVDWDKAEQNYMNGVKKR